jgi:hypothetical protein
VGPAVAGQAVDGKLALNLAGRQLSIRVVGTASRFPTVVRQPSNFVVVDYETLFAALNADYPGAAVASEAWFGRSHQTAFGAQLRRPPFRAARVVAAEPLRVKLLNDPLAAGTRDVLAVTASVAAVLALLGLLVAIGSTLRAERLLIAEYQALGVPKRTLTRSIELRLLVLSALGLSAGLLGAFVALRMTGGLVAVTGTASFPLPSIVPVVAWAPVGALVVGVGVGTLVAVVALVQSALREPVARRLHV